MTLYDELGVAPSASRAELRAAYIAAARRHHPDLQPGPGGSAGARMQRINEAWEVLSDPQRRRAYDAQLASTAASGSASRPGGAGSGSAAGSRQRPAPPADPPRDWRAYVSPGPATQRSTLSRLVAVAPAALGTSAVLLLGLGAMLRVPGFMTLAVFCASGGIFAFLAAPLLALKEERSVRRGRGGGRGPSPHRRQG
jgi:hypothetical protein